jgi:hypothetical protein
MKGVDSCWSWISVNIPNPVEDDIAVNNIAYPEFDYTEDMCLRKIYLNKIINTRRLN